MIEELFARHMKSLLLFISLLHSCILLGQPKVTNYLSLQDGLSNQQVLDIEHDEYGFVWVATELGLNRFASGVFNQYFESEKQDGRSVHSNEINTLFYDSGKLYVGTRSNGLNVLDIQSNTFSYYVHDTANEHSIATNDITDIIKGLNGKLWIATYHQGVQRFDPVKQTFECFNQKKLPLLPENSIWSLAVDKKGTLYIGHVSQGITIFNESRNSIEKINVKTSGGKLPDNEVKTLLCDRVGNIWIGTRKGLAVYNTRTKYLQRIALAGLTKNHEEPFIYSIREVGNEIWVGAESSQLITIRPGYYNNTEVKQVAAFTSVDLGRGNNSSIQQIAPDKFGNIWLGIYGGGVGFISHLKPFFTVFPSREQLLPGIGRLSTVSGILQDKDESIWLATAGNGIVKLDADGVFLHQASFNKGLGDNFLLAVFQDTWRNKWAGLQKGGVAVFDSKSKSWQHIDFGETVTEVRSIMEDKFGNIWMAAQQGLFVYHPLNHKIRKLLINQPMLGDYAPRALVEDSRGYIWVGTYGQGLYVFDQDHRLIKKMSRAEGFKSNTINHLFRDRDKNIWIATNEGIAVQRLDKSIGQLEHIRPPGSDAWLIVDAIAEDRSGNLWCSTKSGLLRYIPKGKRFMRYDQAFGIPLGGFINSSVATDSQGRMFFGMQEGVCYFQPADIPISFSVPPVRISRFTVFNRGESKRQLDKFPSKAEKINLGYDENSFRIQLAVMDFAVNDLVEFSYKLQGLDDDWIYLGNEKNLDFRNVPYRDYELRIRTRIKNGEWSSDYKRLFIDIAPPFYLSTAALVFYGTTSLVVVLLIIFFYVKKIKVESELRIKERQHEQDEVLYTERLNFYTNITHELRTPLTLILSPLDEILNDDRLASRDKKLIQTVQKSASRLFSLVTQLLEFRKVESQHRSLTETKGYLGEALQEIVKKYADLNTKNELAINIELQSPDLYTLFDAEVVQLIFDNLLSNAYKYTTKGQILVKLRYETDNSGNWAIIDVTDTGSGIAAAHLDKIFERFYKVPNSTVPGTGVGLAMVKDLVAIHKGTISVESKKHQGTSFTVRLFTRHAYPEAGEAILPAEPSMPSEAVDPMPLLLLVEDDVDLLEYLSSAMKSYYEVIKALSGDEGFRLATARIPDIIISDIMMPDMDGYYMLNKLKAQRETSHIPLIFLTAKDTEPDRQRGYELGADSFLTKPVSIQLLHKRIENLRLKRKFFYAEVLRQISSEHPPVLEEDLNKEQNLWRENSFVQDFVKIVEEHMHDEVLDASTLSERFNMSQSTLYRKLKGITGKNINQLVRKVRMHKAAELLRSGKYNVSEVSVLVGINSAIYFRQCFREEFGQLPSDYQKNTVNKRI